VYRYSVSEFKRRVLTLVKAIPPGRVCTYGQIALLAGKPGAARQVGMILHGCSHADGEVPWQRVINAQGGISTYKVGWGELQRALLEAEGVVFDTDGRCDLQRYRYDPILASG
jgi:methylated-DNA-protein-cysteine methyltransferase-like protein